jgi:2-methylfumaryl-CoA isomerase
VTPILAPLRIVENSAFVAAPLAGMTLAQLGADVIRIDRPNGGLDYKRWPVTKDGTSMFWASMNKGKRSIVLDTSKPEGREIALSLICGSSDHDGIFLSNLRSGDWLSYEELRKNRSDLIYLAIKGDRFGNPHMDYTINPAVGFALATGPKGSKEPVAHVLPAWDCITGYQAAIGLVCAAHHRKETKQGQEITLNLKDVALSVLDHLGIIAEATLNDSDRPKLGNGLYGGYAQNFTCSDGAMLIVVALTSGQWRSLKAATNTEETFQMLGSLLHCSFEDEADRFRHADAISDVLRPLFKAMPFHEAKRLLHKHGATWSLYRTFREVVNDDDDCSVRNPIFSEIHQPGIGATIASGSPLEFSGIGRSSPSPAPQLGRDTEAILYELGFCSRSIGRLYDQGIVA